MRQRLVPLFLALLVATALAGLRPHASRAAAERAQFGLQPVTYNPAVPASQSYFIFDLHPGATTTSQVRVVNTGDATGTVHLYAVDATTGQTSGTVFRTRQDPRQDAGAWIALDAADLTLQPGEGQVVAFTVSVPADVRPGQHVGGIVAENATSHTSAAPPAGGRAAGFQITVQNLTILAVQVNLPGPAVEQLDVTGIQAGGGQGYQTVLVGLRNRGTGLIKPAGTLTLTDTTGQEVQHLRLTLDTVLPDTTIQYPVAVARQALGAGTYHATLDLTYGAHGVTHYAGDLTITPAQVAQVFASSTSAAPLAPPPTAAGRPARAATGWRVGVGLAAALGLLVLLLTGFWLGRRAAARKTR